MARTPLYDTHAKLGATFTSFAGFDMPVHYGSIKEEHLAVRSAVGVFDVSHMSNLDVAGRHAAKAIATVAPMDPAALDVGRGKYTVLLHDDGTILDDAFVFRLGEEQYHIIPNAGRNEAAAAHLRAAGATVEDVTPDVAILAVQGPTARSLLKEVIGHEPAKLHRIIDVEVAGVACRLAGTGYTGEKGGELLVPAAQAKRVFDAVVEAGARPIGLGARDTLRLEKGYCLAGNEFEGGRTPLEANLGWLIDWDVGFRARPALHRQRDAGHELLWGLVQQKGIPRHGYAVLKDGQQRGRVTSGTLSPSLGHGIALAYLSDAKAGLEVSVDVRGRAHDAVVQAPPFL